MKTKIKHIVTTVIFIMMVATVMAQPLPPSTPSGSPLPVGGLEVVFLFVMMGFGLKQLLKNQKLK